MSFAMVKVTSAMERAGRESVPLKMTSSIVEARRFLDLFSARTHFMASTTLLLPQPFGPKRAVMPSANFMTVLSANDLNPYISRLFKNTNVPPL